MSDASVTMQALALFDEALEQPDATRERWLEETCGRNATLLREVRALLAAAGRTRGVLDASPTGAYEHAFRDALSDALCDAYVLGREIGRGGMATVYLARERKHDRDVVIKVLDPYVAHSCGADRFLREIRIAATLAHPHIVPLIDSGQAGDYLYYVMPWMEGETLRDRIRRGPPSMAEGIGVLRDIAGALAFAHDAGVVHRDLKPENVLLTDGHAYLLDFGIAKLIDASTPSVSITSPGFALGTKRYMAPEQAVAADQVDSRADIYAWGVLGAEFFSGQSLPGGPAQSSVPDTLARHVGMPRALARLLTEAVSTNPDRRPRSMAAVVQQLDAISISGATPVIPATRRAPYIAVAVAALATLAAGVFAWQREPVANGMLAEPIAVTILNNEAGDSAMSVVGRFAGDWVTDGLQRMGGVQVVPWSQALLASQRAIAGKTPLVSTVHDEVKAGTVVTGTYYRLRDSLYLRAQLNDGRTGKLISALAPIVFPVTQPESGVRQLRDRVMGAVAAARDDRVFTQADLARTPPSFPAYQAFDEGFDRYLDQQYDDALKAFRTAYARDTTFSLALLFAARAAWNVDQYAVAESLITRARQRSRDLGVYHDASLRYLEALLEGNGERARAAIQRAAVIAPNSRAGFDHAAALMNAGYARAAREQLLQIDPDRGEMRGWSPYWTQRVHAAYMIGNHAEERDAAREMARRHPDRRVALVLEARAMASQHDVRALDSALVAWDSLPTNVYWSQGAAMVVAAEELMRRGHDADGRRYAQRAVAWLSNRLVATPNDRAHRYWMGSVLYDMGDFQGARPYFEGLAREFPDRLLYSGLSAVVAARRGDVAAANRWLVSAPARQTGDRLAYQARIAAIAGDTEQAVVLLTSAVDHGVEGYAWFPGAAFRDLAALANDPRGRALLNGR